MEMPLETLVNDQNGDHEKLEGETTDEGAHNVQGGEMEELKQQDSGSAVEQDSSDSKLERVEMRVDSGEDNEAGSDDGDSDASSDYEEIDPDMGPLVANRPPGPLSEAQRAYNSFINASPASEADSRDPGSASQLSDSRVNRDSEEDRPRTPEDQVAITEVEPDFTPRTARRLTTERERGYDRRFRPRSAVIALANDTIVAPRFPRLQQEVEQQATAEEARLDRQAKAIPAASTQNRYGNRAHPQARPSIRNNTGSSRSPSPLRLTTVLQGPEEDAWQGNDTDSAAPSSAFSDDSDSDDDDAAQSVEDERDEVERGHDSQDNISEPEDMTASVAPALVEPDPDSSSEASTSKQSLEISTALAQVGASLAVPGEHMIANPPLSPVLESVPEEPDDSPLNPVDYYPRFADAYQSFESIDSKITSPKPEKALRFSGNSGQEESLADDGSKEPELTQTQTSVHNVPSEISARARVGLQEDAHARAKALQEEGVAFLSSDSISPSEDLDARAQIYMELALEYREERDAERQLVQELKDKFVAQLPAENIEYLQLQLAHSKEQLSTANEEKDGHAEKSRRYKEACEKLKKQVDAYQERINKFNTYIDDLQDRVQSLEDESQGLKDKNASLENTVADNKEVDEAQKKAIDEYREITHKLHEHIEKLSDPEEQLLIYERELEKQSQVIADLEEELQTVSADLRKQERQHQIEIQEQRDEFARSQSEVETWMEQHVSEYKKTLQEKDSEIETLKLQLTTANERAVSENDVPAIAVEPVPDRAPLVKAQPRSIDAVLANEYYNAKPQPLPAAPLPGVPEPKGPRSPLSPLPIAPSDPQPWQDRVHKWRDSSAWKAQREALRQRRLAEAAHEEQYQKVKRAAWAVTYGRVLPEREGDKGLTEKKNRLAFYENIRIRPKQQSEKLSPVRSVHSEPEPELSPGSTDALSIPGSARLLRSPRNRGHERLSDWVED